MPTRSPTGRDGQNLAHWSLRSPDARCRWLGEGRASRCGEGRRRRPGRGVRPGWCRRRRSCRAPPAGRRGRGRRRGSARRPGGVRSTTRLALASAEMSSSPSSRASRCGGASSPRRAVERRAVLGHDVDRQAAVGRAQLHRAELVEIARQRGLRDVQAAGRRAARRARPASARGARPGRRRCGRAGPPWCGRRRASWRLIGALQQEGQQRLLRVQPVLGLVPDDALRAVDDLGRDLLAAVGGQAVQHDRVGAAAAERRGGRRRTARTAPRARPARPPGPSTPRCRWRRRRRRRAPPPGRSVTVTEPPVPAAMRSAVGDDRRIGLVAGRAGDADVQPGRGAAEQVGVRHVVGGVAEVGEGQPGEPLLVLADRLQVGEDLARVELVGQRVDDRHRADRRHLLDAVLAVGAPDDRGDLPGEHAGGVGDRLAHADAGQPAVDDDRVAAELGDADARTTAGCAASACRRSARPTCGPASGRCRCRSAFIASARSSTSSSSSGARSSSRRKCLGHRRDLVQRGGRAAAPPRRPRPR